MEENLYVNDFNFINPDNYAMSAGGAKPYGFRLNLENLQKLVQHSKLQQGSDKIKRDGVQLSEADFPVEIAKNLIVVV